MGFRTQERNIEHRACSPRELCEILVNMRGPGGRAQNRTRNGQNAGKLRHVVAERGLERG
eukprot:5391866-Lingulodinium_polyedra.AAC.1